MWSGSRKSRAVPSKGSPGCSSARIHDNGMSREPCDVVYQVPFCLSDHPWLTLTRSSAPSAHCNVPQVTKMPTANARVTKTTVPRRMDFSPKIGAHQSQDCLKLQFLVVSLHRMRIAAPYPNHWHFGHDPTMWASHEQNTHRQIQDRPGGQAPYVSSFHRSKLFLIYQ